MRPSRLALASIAPAAELAGAADIEGAEIPRSSGPYLTSGRMQIIRRRIEFGAQSDKRSQL
jgi:hypothetical protein